MKKTFTLIISALLVCSIAKAQTAETVTFEDVTMPEGQTCNNNATTGYFQSGSYRFVNNYSSLYGSWDGFAVSQNTGNAYSGDYTDATQFNSCVGHGADNSKTFMVGYVSTWGSTNPIAIYSADNKTFKPQSADITNAAYAFKSMREGDSFAKQFTASDYFTLTITGKKNGVETGSVNVDMAKDAMLLFTWKTIDLTPLGSVDNVTFVLTSSDNDPTYGMNTPSYFCLDNFVAITENSSATKIATPSNTTNAKVTGIYNPDGSQKDNITSGVNILKYSDGSFRKIYK